MSLTTLVLTVTLVAVQLEMGQYSPRIVGSLLKDRPSQLRIGLFGATFVQTVLTLREVDDQAPGVGTVPGLSMLVCYALMLVCVVAVILLAHHSGQSLRAAGLIGLVGGRQSRTDRQVLPRCTPRDRWPDPRRPPHHRS